MQGQFFGSNFRDFFFCHWAVSTKLKLSIYNISFHTLLYSSCGELLFTGRKMSSANVCLEQSSFKTELGFNIHYIYVKLKIKKTPTIPDICWRVLSGFHSPVIMNYSRAVHGLLLSSPITNLSVWKSFLFTWLWLKDRIVVCLISSLWTTFSTALILLQFMLKIWTIRAFFFPHPPVFKN